MEPEKRAKNLTFGQIAIGFNFATADQVLDCVLIQKKMKDMGLVPKRIGEIMVEKAYITQDQAETIFRIQGREGGHLEISGYQIQKKLGEGQMGAVYLAKQMSMDRLVALKIMAPHLARNEKFVERFMREARAVARLNHINIISGFDVGESNGINYFAMEYVDGPTLISLLERGGALDEKRALNVALQIARALEHAHKNGMVHRDIKPDNIMIARDGTAKLCDLGLAREAGKTADASERGQSLGTPNYISPEQAKGQTDIDIRSDLYSLGATFYHMLTGQPPYQGSAAVVMTKHISTPIPDPRSLNPQVSKVSAFLIQQMTAKDRGARYQTPTHLVEDLERALKGEKPRGPRIEQEVLVAQIEGGEPEALEAEIEEAGEKEAGEPPAEGGGEESKFPTIRRRHRRYGIPRRRRRR
jgi:serine/threonine protein kinase